eukprot:sb/3478877/
MRRSLLPETVITEAVFRRARCFLCVTILSSGIKKPSFASSSSSSIAVEISFLSILRFCASKSHTSLSYFFPAWVNARRALTQDDVFSTHTLKRSFRV